MNRRQVSVTTRSRAREIEEGVTDEQRFANQTSFAEKRRRSKQARKTLKFFMITLVCFVFFKTTTKLILKQLHTLMVRELHKTSTVCAGLELLAVNYSEKVLNFASSIPVVFSINEQGNETSSFWAAGYAPNTQAAKVRVTETSVNCPSKVTRLRYKEIFVKGFRKPVQKASLKQAACIAHQIDFHTFKNCVY